jgi:photosystem II stability/assembly factor-like uncharacterized protein
MMCRSTAALALLLFLAGNSFANGRFPASNEVGFQSGNPRRLLLETTFGVVISEDGGQTWYWECEDALGYGGTFDPVLTSSASGAIFAGLFTGLAITRDGGCNWIPVGDPLVKQWVSDITIGPDGTVWAGTATGGNPNDVFVSHDDGVTFAHANLPLAQGWVRRVRVAPTDARRIYVAAYRVDDSADAGSAYISLFFRSDDGGQTWMSMPAAGNFPGLQLLYVSPTDENVLFADVTQGPEMLLRSADGGGTWTPVLHPSNHIAMVVSQPDGIHYLAANPMDSASFSSDDGGQNWTLGTKATVMNYGALGPDGTIFVCANNWDPDRFALGKSTDGVNFTPVFRFNQMSGPLACPAGTMQHDTCAPMWPTLSSQFAIPPDAAPAPDAPTPPTTGGKCGCGISLAFALVAPLGVRRRRRAQKSCS